MNWTESMPRGPDRPQAEDPMQTRDFSLDGAAFGPEDPAGTALLQIGDLIGSHYRIRGVLGSGGMGIVYLAHDEHLDRQVAVKRVHSDKLDHEAIRTGFVTEARAMARIQHPNVVTVYAFGDLDTRPYFVMEYVPGHNLAMWMRAQPRPSPTDAMAVLDPLCRGVTAIHEAGALHRDIKPSNVLIGPGQRVAVADFGLAHALTESGPSGMDAPLVGTPGYLAPELARAEDVVHDLAPRIDVYALGVLAYELLTGCRPFMASGLPGLLAEHAFAPPPRPTSKRSDLSDAFEGPLLQALAKDPRERTPDVETLRRELTRALEVSTAPPSDLTILVADDDPATLVAVRELLAMSFPDANIVTAADAVSAFVAVKEVSPDVVITDLRMPNGGGEALTRALKADPDTSDIPSIVVTAHGGAHDWRKLKALGADRFLVKPIDFDTLANMVRSLTRA